ncbi:polynucleotide 5'-hydroxyl-kinase NOL9-like [Pelmatolapia mariae]|uniref:polynucleotide 5'-hydroxyl-kinase NOL9-like n=1 Tax=Pelmatolapia mariae TaxID=158779 RepID=UPI003211E843
MSYLQTLCFRGKCLLTCLYGCIEVMGFTIEEGQQSYSLFSPASHCPLSIRGLESIRALESRNEASHILQRYLPQASRKKLLKSITTNSSIILLEPIETPMTRFLSSFPDLSDLFNLPMTELMSAVLDTPLNGLGMIPLDSNIKGLQMSKSYRHALNTVVSVCKGDIDGCPVILVCGTKNVGKSTFIRVLINTLLNYTASVEYLEGDLGQTEFTPAGCLSLLTVREPLLGPPFTHQQTPDHMIYYGQSSCDSDLDQYVESLKSLWCRRSQTREAPIIINTMGWVKGFGIQLLVYMIRFFPVSHVVQLSHSGVNQCPALTPDFLRTANGFQTHPPAQTALDEFTESHSPPRIYSHISIQAEFQGVGSQGTARSVGGPKSSERINTPFAHRPPRLGPPSLHPPRSANTDRDRMIPPSMDPAVSEERLRRELSHSGVNQCPALTPDFLRTANGFQTHPPAQTALDEFTESHSPPRIYSHISIQAEFQGVGSQGTARSVGGPKSSERINTPFAHRPPRLGPPSLHPPRSANTDRDRMIPPSMDPAVSEERLRRELSHSGVNQCPALTPDFLRTANGFQTHPPAQTALDEFTESHSPPRIYSHISIQAEFQGVGSQGTARSVGGPKSSERINTLFAHRPPRLGPPSLHPPRSANTDRDRMIPPSMDPAVSEERLRRELLVYMIRFFPVSHVVQLSHSGVNQCPALTPDFLRTANGFQTHPPAQTALDEFTESHSPPRIYSHIRRQMAFRLTHPPRPLWMSLQKATAPQESTVTLVYKQSFKELGVKEQRVLRGIDMARGLYFLLTPVDPSVLREVNCLLLGAISMPSCILKTQPGIDGEMPYITTDYSFDFTGAGKLRVFKGMTRPSQVGMQ